MGRGGVAVVGKPRLVVESRKGDGRQGNKMPDRQRRENLPIMILVPQPNCGGCLAGAFFVVLRFSCPFLSLLVVFCLFITRYVIFVLSCFVCHMSAVDYRVGSRKNDRSCDKVPGSAL